MSYGAKLYKKASVTTATPGQILIMLYEAAIRNVKKASLCIEKGDMAGKGEAIAKAHDIINELNTTLDHSVGWEASKDLEALYNFMVNQLLRANLENSKQHLDEIVGLLDNLLQGWRVAVEQSAKQQAAPQPGKEG